MLTGGTLFVGHRALTLLEEGAGTAMGKEPVLKVEDVLGLPNFSESTTISKFKTVIEKSLERSSRDIDGLKQDMKQCTDNADKIRGEIKQLRRRYVCRSELHGRPRHHYSC